MANIRNPTLSHLQIQYTYPTSFQNYQLSKLCFKFTIHIYNDPKNVTQISTICYDPILDKKNQYSKNPISNLNTIQQSLIIGI